MPDVSDGDKKRPDPEQAAAAFWEATMQALSANWPVLRQLLLSGAVQRIAQPFLRGPLEPQSGATPEFSGASATVEQSSSGSLSSLEVWIRRLLGVAERGVGPKRRKQQKAGSKRKSGAAKPEGRPPWKPSQQQLTALLATCLRALSKGAAFVDAFPQSEERLAVLRSVFAILTDQAGSVADTVDSGLQSRVQKLAELSGAFGPAETECGSDSIIEGISQMQQAANEAEASHAKLMDRLRQSQQARPQAQKCASPQAIALVQRCSHAIFVCSFRCPKIDPHAVLKCTFLPYPHAKSAVLAYLYCRKKDLCYPDLCTVFNQHHVFPHTGSKGGGWQRIGPPARWACCHRPTAPAAACPRWCSLRRRHLPQRNREARAQLTQRRSRCLIGLHLAGTGMAQAIPVSLLEMLQQLHLGSCHLMRCVYYPLNTPLQDLCPGRIRVRSGPGSAEQISL